MLSTAVLSQSVKGEPRTVTRVSKDAFLVQCSPMRHRQAWSGANKDITAIRQVDPAWLLKSTPSTGQQIATLSSMPFLTSDFKSGLAADLERAVQALFVFLTLSDDNTDEAFQLEASNVYNRANGLSEEDWNRVFKHAHLRSKSKL